MTRIAILGGGSWGTALAIVLSRSPLAHQVSLWVHDHELAERMQRSRENVTHLPSCLLPRQVQVSHDVGQVVSGAATIIGAMPSGHAREVYKTAALQVASQASVVSATKGLEPATHQRMTEVIAHVLPRARVAALSGPSFALEVANGTPTAVVVASRDVDLTAKLQQEFAAPNFRLYTNDDVLGVELGGAVKNVIAIAAGACHALALGDNTLAALITRGLAEMSRLAVALGARPETLSGLAGLGDLVLTCNGALSRNRSVGIELAKGRSLPDITSGMHGVAEGVGTAAALLALARENQIDLPITQQVDAILNHGKSPREAIREIMERPQKRE